MTVWLPGNRGQMFSLSPGRRTCWMCNVLVVRDDTLCMFCLWIHGHFFFADVFPIAMYLKAFYKETSISWWCKIISNICPKALQWFCALIYMVCLIVLCVQFGVNKEHVFLMRKLWCSHGSWRAWLCRYQQLIPLMSTLRSLFASLHGIKH